MKPILPGATLGVMGGGQLGRMFVHAAQRLGYFTAVLDPDPESPAGRVSHHHVQADYVDVDALAHFAGLADAITTEFENVPAASLEHLAVARPVSPAAAAVAIAQDRIREKAHFVGCGVDCAPYVAVESDDVLSVVPANLFPGLLKTARLGYDGKGQQRVGSRAELVAAWKAVGQQPCVLEKLMPIDYECSVVLARGRDGLLVHYPPQRNLHRGGILAVTEAHDQALPDDVAQRAAQAALSIAEGMEYVGVLCVEFFVLEGGALVVNEMAPRPHNSGHWTTDACDVSQFELQVRTLTGLPLNPPRQHSPAVMLNLLGDLWFLEADGVRPDKPLEPRWADVLKLPGTHLHLYGKVEPRAGRKMGHLTLTGDSVAAVRSTADFAAAMLGLPIPLTE
ncbi:N5-carboxyaminoimidazole ribonucleotide synthase [Burkholderiales bacterium 8X]|nr:N5-carboxyaminoimidazole ribonucleotide synthase [Burkholderiales bacterium 8X]